MLGGIIGIPVTLQLTLSRIESLSVAEYKNDVTSSWLEHLPLAG